MSKSKRQSGILDIVSKERKISVKDLATICRVSEVTIRKDLDELSDMNLLERKHGYAYLQRTDEMSARMAFKNSLKRNIAKKAFELIQDGDTVMIESGSTCALFAETIATHSKDVQIITNSTFIATLVRYHSYGRITLIGGDYQKQSEVCVGPVARSQVGLYHVDRLFVGTDGFDPNKGFTGGDSLRIDVVREMAKNAEEVIILTDSSKFTQKGVLHQFHFDEIHSVYTDDHISLETKHCLKEHGISVIEVKN